LTRDNFGVIIYRMEFKVDRKKCVLKKLHEEDNGYVDADPAARVSMVWELTKQAWAFAGINAEQRLQRNVAKLIRIHRQGKG
jgi:hypothetical protein